MRDPFHLDRGIARVTVPLLMMHGTNDLAIPIAFGERLSALGHVPKRIVPMAGGGHDNLDQYGAIETARDFIGN